MPCRNTTEPVQLSRKSLGFQCWGPHSKSTHPWLWSLQGGLGPVPASQLNWTHKVSVRFEGESPVLSVLNSLEKWLATNVKSKQIALVYTHDVNLHTAGRKLEAKWIHWKPRLAWVCKRLKEFLGPGMFSGRFQWGSQYSELQIGCNVHFWLEPTWPDVFSPQLHMLQQICWPLKCHSTLVSVSWGCGEATCDPHIVLLPPFWQLLQDPSCECLSQQNIFLGWWCSWQICLFCISRIFIYCNISNKYG